MGNLVLGVNSEIAYYFANKTRDELNPIIDACGSVSAAAKQENVKIQLVIDFVSIANNVGLIAEDVDYMNKKLNLIFGYQGLKESWKKRHLYEIDFDIIHKSYFTTVVTLVEQPQGGGIPDSDSGSNTTAVPPDENNVAGKANDE